MGLSDQIREYLKGITLEQLLDKHQIQETAKRQSQDAQIITLHKNTDQTPIFNDLL